MEAKKENFFEWLYRLEMASLQSGCDICMEAWGRAGDGVSDHLIGMPNEQPSPASQEVLKRCFTYPTSLGHATTQLENVTQ